MGGTPAWRRAGLRAVALVPTVLLALVVNVTPGRALAPPAPWDGVNPFRCTVQDAGQGSSVPDPAADPYCVRFDKSNQNVTQLGLISFLTEEPARFGAAAPKCFYYQEDHWRGSVIQSDQQTVVYEFYGHYFFNKATGDGGVWVTGFSLGGQTFDPRNLPGFPPQYDQYFGPGTGGVISHNDVPADPNCVARADQSPRAIYARPPSGCLSAHGAMTRRHIGPVGLGASPAGIRARLGPPRSSSRDVMAYCLTSGGGLFIGMRNGPGGSRAGPRAVVLTTTGSGFALRGRNALTVAVGASARRLDRAYPQARRLFRRGRVTFFALTAVARPARGHGRHGAIIAGVVNHRVAFLTSYDADRIGPQEVAASMKESR